MVANCIAALTMVDFFGEIINNISYFSKTLLQHLEALVVRFFFCNNWLQSHWQSV